ncbi:UNVERIFIED_CONTAM: Toxoplasma gondii family A protein [Hammondia hammondi]|eukprot:XP_008887109.1 Toxoplasma gondii family A protein [Hammondia hammondi]
MTIQFKAAFPGYMTRSWVPEQSTTATGGSATTAGFVRYTFTNPHAEYWGGELSFCLRFQTLLASGSNSETTISTPTTSATSREKDPDDAGAEEDTDAEAPNSEVPTPQPSPQQSPVPEPPVLPPPPPSPVPPGDSLSPGAPGPGTRVSGTSEPQDAGHEEDPEKEEVPGLYGKVVSGDDRNGHTQVSPQPHGADEDHRKTKKNGSNEENFPGQYGSAYLFLNGACDFEKTIQLKDVFPGYSQPLWVREESSSSRNVESASSKGPVRYIFTNPPEGHLGKATRFCVRFKTIRASGSNTETSTTAPTTSATSGGAQTGGATIPGNGNITAEPEEPEQQPEDSVTPSPPLTDNNGSGGQVVPGPGATDDGDQNEEEKDEKPVLLSVNPPVAGGDGQVPESEPEQGSPKESPNSSAGPSPPEDNIGESEAQKEAYIQGGGDQLGSARLRRLSVTPEAEEAFLTIVVHSATRSVAGGISALSVFLSAAVAILLQVL